MTKKTCYSCRSCGSPELSHIISFGKTPLANALLTDNRTDLMEERYDLDLMFCSTCSLVQIAQTIPPEKLFVDYPFYSSCSDTTLERARKYANRFINSQNLNNDSLVVEIGSNDGYLLQYYKYANIPVLGIEPARNIARFAQEERGIETLCSFFDLNLAEKLVREGTRADVIHLHNVLAHVKELNGFVEGLKILLKNDGIVVIEVPYVKDLIDQCQFATIYHEHLSYFSLLSLDKLLVNHGLEIIRCENSMNQGGSLLVVASRFESNKNKGILLTALSEEERLGLNRAEYYENFADQVIKYKETLKEKLIDLKIQNKHIAGYGASAKGSQLLNYCGIGNSIIDFVIDNIPYKQGKYIPGVRIPVYPPSYLLEVMPEYVIILAWNLANEIISQEMEYLRLGGQFIIPFPQIQTIKY